MSAEQASLVQRVGKGRPITWQRLKASLEYRIASRSFRAFEAAKAAMHGAIGSRPTATLFIFGAQRSGTTHLERLFRADPRSVVFGEFSALSTQPEKTAWPPLPEVRSRLQTGTGRYAVARSLLASHRAGDILDAFTGSRAVWMFRPADEVVNSMLHKWDGNFEEISRRVETDDTGQWDLEGLWRKITEQTKQLSNASPGSRDWMRDLYGLYWHARNAAYFDTGLSEDDRISLLSYRSLQLSPARAVGTMVSTVGLKPSWSSFPLKTRGPRATKPQHPRFSPNIQSMCDDLLARLQQAEAQGK